MAGFADSVLIAARVATGVLGWSPERFWGATPAELLTAIEGRFGDVAGCVVVPLASGDLRRMQERFPDG